MKVSAWVALAAALVPVSQAFAAQAPGSAPPAEAAPAAPPDDGADKPDDDGFGHGRQLGARAAIAGGYRMVLRYDESPYCSEPKNDPAEDEQSICGHVMPFALDLGLSFAPLDFLEPFAWFRLGLAPEDETDTESVMVLGAGIRFYTLSDSALKFFVEPAVGLELEGGQDTPAYQTNNPEYKTDVLFRMGGGLQFDFAKNVGAFADAGLGLGIFRALHSSLEGRIGLQLRAP